jgi:hypothetical protein
LKLFKLDIEFDFEVDFPPVVEREGGGLKKAEVKQNADKLFEHLQATAFQLTVIEGGRLKVEPKDKITDALRDEI